MSTESLLEDVACEKCGGGEIVWVWHRTNWSHATARRKGCLYADNAQPSGEHLHGYCQRCRFDFFEDVADRA